MFELIFQPSYYRQQSPDYPLQCQIIQAESGSLWELAPFLAIWSFEHYRLESLELQRLS